MPRHRERRQRHTSGPDRRRYHEVRVTSTITSCCRHSGRGPSTGRGLVSALLETTPAEHRAPLGWAERDRGLAATVRTPDGERDARAAIGVCLPVRGAAPLAGRTAPGHVFECPVGKEPLLASRPDEVGTAGRALQVPVFEVHRADPLLSLAALLLPAALAGQGLLCASPVAGLHVEGMLLDVLDDVLLLDLALETPERALDRFALLHLHFSHWRCHPLTAERRQPVGVTSPDRDVLR